MEVHRPVLEDELFFGRTSRRQLRRGPAQRRSVDALGIGSCSGASLASQGSSVRVYVLRLLVSFKGNRKETTHFLGFPKKTPILRSFPIWVRMLMGGTE